MCFDWLFRTKQARQREFLEEDLVSIDHLKDQLRRWEYYIMLLLFSVLNIVFHRVALQEQDPKFEKVLRARISKLMAADGEKECDEKISLLQYVCHFEWVIFYLFL